MTMEDSQLESGSTDPITQDTSGAASTTRRNKEPTEDQREARRLALLNPAFMRAQEYEGFRKYGETYVTAPDSYARPQIPKEIVNGIISVGLAAIIDASTEGALKAASDLDQSSGER
jgi:hypothetical protein